MSLRLETLNQGQVENFGFSHGGTYRVLLGELPAMPTQQFCKLAGDVLIEISTLLDEPEWERIGNALQLAFARDAQTPADKESVLDLPEFIPVEKTDERDLSDDNFNILLQSLTIPDDLAERLENATEQEQRKIADDIIANLIIKNGWTAVPYQENPFEITDSGVSIGQKYELSFLEFGLFVSQVLGGGWFGWDKDRGMPKEAKTTLDKLRQIW